MTDSISSPSSPGPSGVRRDTTRGLRRLQRFKVGIPPEAVDPKFIEALEYFLGVIAGPEPAFKVPSRHECRFCDIARTECPERIEG